MEKAVAYSILSYRTFCTTEAYICTVFILKKFTHLIHVKIKLKHVADICDNKFNSVTYRMDHNKQDLHAEVKLNRGQHHLEFQRLCFKSNQAVVEFLSSAQKMCPTIYLPWAEAEVIWSSTFMTITMALRTVYIL